MMSKTRQVQQIYPGLPASDGEGVKLTRVIGTPNINRLDPFLLLDVFGSDKSQDYIGGFPPHPHRGFETVTYMLAGKMRHKDSAGNEGVIERGGIQWMTAGKGIIHSEMPEQEEGLLAGLQLWVNLPASHKMTEPKYQEYHRDLIPIEHYENGVSLKVIAGTTQSGTQGVINNHFVEPIFWDVDMPINTHFNTPLPVQHQVFIYMLEGEVIIGEQMNQPVSQGQLAVLQEGDRVDINAQTQSRFVLIGGKPLNEPIKRAGPFVMNTQAEIEQAFSDYKSGNFI